MLYHNTVTPPSPSHTGPLQKDSFPSEYIQAVTFILFTPYFPQLMHAHSEQPSTLTRISEVLLTALASSFSLARI